MKMLRFFDDRRDIIIPGNAQETLVFCAEQFINIGNESIQKKGVYNVALSGGSTPRSLFILLAGPSFNSRLDWSCVQLFWSDERNVPPDDEQSNYKMAMNAGFSSLPIPVENIHRMPAEGIGIEETAKKYEAQIIEFVQDASFDLVMLGMGEDGHTASLFPKTHGLHTDGQLVVANFIPQLNTWRMSLTYHCINSAHHISIYVIGKNKAAMLKRVLCGTFDPDELPIQKIGTRTHKALWIADAEAASELNEEIPIQDITS